MRPQVLVGLRHFRRRPASLRSSRAAAALCDYVFGGPVSGLSNQLVLSMVCARFPVAGRGAAHAGKASPASPHPPCPRPPPPHPPARPPPAPGASRGCSLRRWVVAVPVPQEGSGPAPPRDAPDGPVRARIHGSGRIHFRGRGEPWVWGRGAVGALGGKLCALSWVGARASCRLRQALGFRCSLPWRPVELPERVSGWRVSATPGPVLQPGLGLAPRALESRPTGFQAEEILRISRSSQGVPPGSILSKGRYYLACFSISLLNSDSQPPKSLHTHPGRSWGPPPS